MIPPIQNLEGKTVYISGAITSDPNHEAKFAQYEQVALDSGATRVFNPVKLLHKGYNYDEYMEVDLIFVRRADVTLMLPCWPTSPGAKAERAYAECLKKEIIEA